MKVRELIDQLGEFDPDAPVFTVDPMHNWVAYCEVTDRCVGQQRIEDLDNENDRHVIELDKLAIANRNLHPRSPGTNEWTAPAIVIAGPSCSFHDRKDEW